MFDDYEDLLTVEDLCSILLIGKNTAYDLLRHKQIRAFKIGHTWKIPKKSIEEYILIKSKLVKPDCHL